ncbi:MAG: GNAT family N-acetyltransferase [Propionibacteriales bacterium]|nr:GNAT family N-acetyltransferase [Propionibacteriales bacterium]
MSLQIRLAEPSEYDEVGDLTVTGYLADDLLPPDSPYVSDLRAAKRRAEEAELWVAVDGGGILGTVTFCPPDSSYRELASDGDGEFRMLTVHPDARGRGIGAALVRRCLDRAREFGQSRVVISSAEQMRTAHRIYDRFGFERLPELDWKPAPDVQLLAFALELEPPETSVSGR